jgi:glycine/D-amino acid oxidase-like deaminating enzyme
MQAGVVTPDSASRDVIVIGGGVAGCAIARALAPAVDVLVLEKGRIAGEASGLAAGHVNPSLTYPDYPAVARHIRSWFETYDGTGDVRLTSRARLELALDGDGPSARDRAAELDARDLPVTFLDGATVESRYPTIDMDGYAGAMCYGDAGWVDPYTYTTALRADAVDRGAEFRTGVRVTSIEDRAGRGTVRLDAGRVTAEYVVVAAGWRTPELLTPLVEVPVRPFLTQCVVLEPDSPLENEFPMGRDPRANLYFRPEHNGDLLVGGGRTTDVADPDRASGGIDAQPTFRESVSSAVPRFLRGFENAGLVDGWAGVDGGTPDGHPIVDAPADGPSWLVVASGFHGGGIRDSPVAACLARSIVLDEPLPFDRGPFELDRFASRSRDFPVSKDYSTSTGS